MAYASETYVDHKTELQAGGTSGALHEPCPDGVHGPTAHHRFTTVALVGGVAYGTGSGPSKKASEQAAAREALARPARGKPCA